MRKLGEHIKQLESELNRAKKELNTKLDEIPNLPHFSVPKGKDEEDNVIIREWGSKKVFDFAEKTRFFGKIKDFFTSPFTNDYIILFIFTFRNREVRQIWNFI